MHGHLNIKHSFRIIAPCMKLRSCNPVCRSTCTWQWTDTPSTSLLGQMSTATRISLIIIHCEPTCHKSIYIVNPLITNQYTLWTHLSQINMHCDPFITNQYTLWTHLSQINIHCEPTYHKSIYIVNPLITNSTNSTNLFETKHVCFI